MTDELEEFEEFGQAPRDLGEHLNRVKNSSRCPTCRRPGPMDVFEVAARWPCGHTLDLPPLPKMVRDANRRPRR